MKSDSPKLATPPLLAAAALALLAPAVPAPAQPSLTPHKLTVTKSGSGTGTVRSIAGGIDCGGKCENAYSPGVPVTLQATSGTGFFVGWTGACSGTSPRCSFTMTESRSVGAKFELPKLRVRKDGPSRDFRVLSVGPGIDCGGSCTASFDAGSTVTLEAKGGPSTHFPKWPDGKAGLRFDARVGELFVEVGVGAEESVLAVTAAGSPAFRVRETGQRCALTPGMAGACRLPLEKGRTYTLVSESGRLQFRFGGAAGDCIGKEECSFRVSPDRPTTVSVMTAP